MSRRTATQVIEETLPKCAQLSWLGTPYRRTVTRRYCGRMYRLAEKGGGNAGFHTLKQVARYIILVYAGMGYQSAYDRAIGSHWEGHWYSEWSFDYDRR